MKGSLNTLLCFLSIYLVPVLLWASAIKTDTIQAKIVLENEIVRFEFSPEHLGLSAMIDLETGHNHIQKTDHEHSLWQLTFSRGTQQHTLSNSRVTCSSYQIDSLIDGSKQALFSWDNMDWYREKGIVDVKITITLPPNSGIAEWRIQVNNDSEFWGLWEVDFPKFKGFLSAGDYDIAAPRRNWGKLFKNCDQELTYEYPTGWSMPMQFLCAMNGMNAVYMATHDPAAWKKQFSIYPGQEFHIKTYVENMGVPGSDFMDPFPVMVGIYRGSWMEACKIYRNFALTAPWTSEGKISERISMPNKLKDVGLWMLVNGSIGPEEGIVAEKNRPLYDAQEYFEVPLASHWYNWHQIQFDNNYPHYFPTREGVPEQARDLVSKGQIIMPYINARIVDTFNDDFNAYLPYTTKDQIGIPHIEIYGTSSGRMASMCPATSFWQNKIAEIVARLGAEVGVNAVYLDQIAAAGPQLCFDASHGHPLGGGSWWVTGYREMLKKVQKIAHQDGRDMIITTECAAEPYMDGIDGFLIWVKRDARSIPMMTAVYSGYSLYFSSPAWFEQGDRAWIMVQGRDFIWGCQNGWMSPSQLLMPEHENKAAYLKKIGLYRIACKDYLTYGELADLVEPINSIKTVTELWPDHQNKPRSATLPSIQGAIWKSEHNSLAIFLVNYLQNDNIIELNIDLLKYGLTSKGKKPSHSYKMSYIRPEGTSPIGLVPAGIIRIKENLGPWDIRVLEITPSD